MDREVRATKGHRRKHGGMLEQSYNLIVPTKVGTAGLRKRAATEPTGGKREAGVRIC